MLIATAGHIDHGKTALIKALTGIDADRLPEEKKRGITVDLGFAYRHDGDGRSLGFVDVPGHEKLVRTMLAGASGVDFVLLVVAADDGIMPQTREHLAILDLLGQTRGLAVVTKIDKVDETRVAAVVAAVGALLHGSTLADIDVLPVSSHRGDGLDVLESILSAAAAATTVRKRSGGFRLAIDRAFTVTGAGLVVTGLVHAGSVSTGDRLLLMPSGREVRVRGLRAQNDEAESGAAGQRCALNITGARVEKADIARGDWIVATALAMPTSRADVVLRLLPTEARPLRHWTPVHVHAGCADITGRIALLEAASLAPGESALAQIVLDHPTGLLHGDRFVVRDQSAQRTIGGGHVVDPLPPRRNTRKPERLAALRALDQADHGAAMAALIAIAPSGVALDPFTFARNIDAKTRDALLQEIDATIVTGSDGTWVFSRSAWRDWRRKVLDAFEAYQTARPDTFGATIVEILRKFSPSERPALSMALDALVADRAVVRFGQLLHLPGHEVKLSLDEENLWFEVEQALRADDTDPPRVGLLLERLRLEDDALKPLLEKLGRLGKLHRVSKTYFVLPDVVARLAEAAEHCVHRHPDALLTVGQFREATGIGRNATMPMLEFFDRIGLTSRHKDGRRLRHAARTLFPSQGSAAESAVGPGA